MRSESTSAFGHPKLTNPTLGALRLAIFKMNATRAGFSRRASRSGASQEK
jgi:hypothetical protein